MSRTQMACAKRVRDSSPSLGNCNTAAAAGEFRMVLGGRREGNFSGQSYKSRNMISPVQQSFNTIFTKREGEKLETVEGGEIYILYVHCGE